MGLFGSSSSKSSTTNTQKDNSSTNPQAQNLISDGTGASDFASVSTFKISGKKNSMAVNQAQDSILIDDSPHGQFTFNVTVPQTQKPVTAAVVADYVKFANDEQMNQIDNKQSELFVKGSIAAAGVLILWLIMKN